MRLGRLRRGHKRTPAASAGFAKTQSHALRRKSFCGTADKPVSQLASFPVGKLAIGKQLAALCLCLSQFPLSKVGLLIGFKLYQIEAARSLCPR
jgi:hypothetical protein